MSRLRWLLAAATLVLAGVVWTDAPQPARAQAAVWTLAGTTQSQQVEPDSRCFSTEANITLVAASFITHQGGQCGENGIMLSRHRWGEPPATMTPGQTVRWNIQADVSGSAEILVIATTKLSVLGGEEIVAAKAGDTLIRNNRAVDWQVPGPTATGELVLVVRADSGGRGWVETRWRYILPGVTAAPAVGGGAAAAATTPPATPYEPVLRPEPAITLMGPSAAIPGREITYTVLLRNDGNDTMNGVALTVRLSFVTEIAGGTRLVSVRGGYSCAMSENEPVVTCSGPPIAPGSGAVVELTIKAPDNPNLVTAVAAVRCSGREQPVAGAPVETAVG